MKKGTRVLLGTLGLVMGALIVSLALIWSGIVAPPWPSGALSASPSPTQIKDGVDVDVPAQGGAPEVYIPASNFTGNGKISIQPVNGPESLPGWAIALEGATLTGEATLRFKNAVTKDQPAPLIGFNESSAAPLTYQESSVVGQDVEVHTTHFSNWFVQNWDWLQKFTQQEVAATFTPATHGSRPNCPREAEVTASGLTVTSNGNSNVNWCIDPGPDADTKILRLNNPRGFAVSVESSPGMDLVRVDPDIGQILPKLIGHVATFPSKPGNEVNIVGPGETVEYTVHTGVASSMGLLVQPSPPAYLATGLWFALQTGELIEKRLYGAASGAVSGALGSVGCLSGMQATQSDVSTADKGAELLKKALLGALSCIEVVLKEEGKGLLKATGAALFAWLVSGVETAIAGFSAAIESGFNPSGYSIVLTPPYRAVLTPPYRAALTPPYRAAVLADGPQAYFHLNEASGAIAADSSPNHNNASYVGDVARGVPGMLPDDPAIQLNASAGYVQGPTMSALSAGNDRTVELWFNTTSPGNLFHAGAPASLQSFELSLVGPGGPGGCGNPGGEGFYLRMWDSDVFVSGIHLTDGGWHYAAITIQNRGQTVGITIDGQQQTGYLWDGACYTATAQPQPFHMRSAINTASAPFTLGGRGYNEGTQGLIDEVAVYPTALSPTRLNAHYAAADGITSR